MSTHMKNAEVAELLATIANDILKIVADEKKLIENNQYTRALVSHDLLNSMVAIQDFVSEQSDRFCDIYDKNVKDEYRV